MDQIVDSTVPSDDGSARVSDAHLSVNDGNLGDPILGRWLEALRRDAPNLPTPIAIAMTQGVSRGPLGQTLWDVEYALMCIETMDFAGLTGSEVRMLAAILRQMNETLVRLGADIARLYSATEQ